MTLSEFAGVTLLIVDDDPENLEILSDAIASSGLDCKIVRAPNGKVAFDLVKKRSIELIKKSWGESVTGSVGLGIAGFLFLLPILAIVALLVSQQWMVAAMIVLGLGIAMQVVFFTALQAVYVTALYHYADSGREGDFGIAELEQAFA